MRSPYAKPRDTSHGVAAFLLFLLRVRTQLSCFFSYDFGKLLAASRAHNSPREFDVVLEPST